MYLRIFCKCFLCGFYAKIELIKSTKNPLKSSSDFLNRYCNIKIIILSLIISFYQKYTNNENQRIFLGQNIVLKNMALYAKFIARKKYKSSKTRFCIESMSVYFCYVVFCGAFASVFCGFCGICSIYTL